MSTDFLIINKNRFQSLHKNIISCIYLILLKYSYPSLVLLINQKLRLDIKELMEYIVIFTMKINPKFRRHKKNNFIVQQSYYYNLLKSIHCLEM